MQCETTSGKTKPGKSTSLPPGTSLLYNAMANVNHSAGEAHTKAEFVLHTWLDVALCRRLTQGRNLDLVLASLHLAHRAASTLSARAHSSAASLASSSQQQRALPARRRRQRAHCLTPKHLVTGIEARRLRCSPTAPPAEPPPPLAALAAEAAPAALPAPWRPPPYRLRGSRGGL